MTYVIPKWLMERYSVLWIRFKGSPFTYNKALATLKENNKSRMNVIISEMRKAGWLMSENDPKDARKRIYRLKSPEEGISGIVKEV